MAEDHDYDGDIELFFEGSASDKYALAFTISYRISAYVAPTRDDPAENGEVSVSAVEIRRNGEKVDCPRWLEEMLLDAIPEEDLLFSYLSGDE